MAHPLWLSLGCTCVHSMDTSKDIIYSLRLKHNCNLAENNKKSSSTSPRNQGCILAKAKMCHFSHPTCKAYLPITAKNKLSLMNKWSRETSITEHELFIPVNPLSMLNFCTKSITVCQTDQQLEDFDFANSSSLMKGDINSNNILATLGFEFDGRHLNRGRCRGGLAGFLCSRLKQRFK